MKISRSTRNAIKAAMEGQFLTQADLASAASVSEATVHRILVKRAGHPHNVRALLAALKIRVAS